MFFYINDFSFKETNICLILDKPESKIPTWITLNLKQTSVKKIYDGVFEHQSTIKVRMKK